MRKQLLCFITVFCIVLNMGILTFKVYADGGKCGDNLTWEYNKQSRRLTISGTGDMYDWEDVWYSDWEYGWSRPWDSYKNISVVVIEDGVTGIGENSFVELKRLMSVTLPNTLTEIRNQAFSLTSLYSVNIPDSVTKIGDRAFTACRNLNVIHIGSSVAEIGAAAFWGGRSN